MISMKGLYKDFGSGDSLVRAVKPVDLEIGKGEAIRILGPSGSGKSTFLNILAGLLHPTGGEIVVDGISLYQELDNDGLARFRREYLGFVFQAFNLLPYLTAMENVLLPLAPLKLTMSEKKDKAEKALEKVDLLDRRFHKPGELSGGQQQRTAIARAIVNEPYILFADEPTGNLDSRTRDEMMDLFGLLHHQGHTFIMVTHDETSGIPTDRLLRITDGEIKEEVQEAQL